MFTKREQAGEVLRVLKSMKACIDINDTFVRYEGRNFNLHRTFGICWHVYAETPPSEITGIGRDYLEPVFLEMGLRAILPVEGQLEYEVVNQWKLYESSNYDRYDPSTEVGQTRIKLVNDLIQYFENVLTTESEPV